MTAGGVGCRVTHRQAVLRNVPALDQGFRLVRDTARDESEQKRRLVRPQL